MSKFVRIKTELRELALIKRALDELTLNYQENQRYTHVWSGFSGQVPLVVQTKGAKFAFRATDEGRYEAIGDDMQMAVVRPQLDAIQQRYAYHKVRDEVEGAGFALVEEQVGNDRVIRMTVRRWV
ncbi:MAG: DUF1257 domain-containing protein [Caldilinea sp.]